MSYYRDNNQAAMARASALDYELRELKDTNDKNKARIRELEERLARVQEKLTLRERRELDSYLYGAEERGYLPSNAGTVLALGILSIVLFSFLGPFAWYYGNQELQKIDLGQADPTRRGEASAGKVLGLIGTVLMAFTTFFGVFVLGILAR